MRKVHMFLVAVAVAVMLSVLVLGAVAPTTTVHIVPNPVYHVAPGDPGGSQGDGGGG
ncbi:MAG TPA: hypothetical protein G4N97_05850 [Thermoflexia bacterium]|nr:hypothetical protein [Thermoflexia bacterium]